MAAKPAGFAAGEAAVSKLGNGSNVDLPFAMFSHQYESKAIKLYYSMSTISYTPWFSYQINMTLIECRQNTERQDRSLGEATRSRHDSTLGSTSGSPYCRSPSLPQCLPHIASTFWTACSLPGVSAQIWTCPHFEAIPRRGKTYFVLSRF